jgi:hypothetical protein
MNMRFSSLAAVLVVAGICSIANTAVLAAPGPPQSDPPAAATDAMTPYRTMAEDILKAFKAGNMDAAKAKGREIQKAWDSEQKGLKAKSPKIWKATDRAMDAFVKPIIKKTDPDPAKVQSAYDDYIAKLNTAAKS